jgi:hypothetical protein
VAAAALVVVIGLYIALLVYIRHAQAPPDVAGLAHSQPVAAADRLAVSATSAALKAVAPDGASWLVPGPTSVSDRCVSIKSDWLLHPWAGTSCVRAVTAYFFFNGSFQQRVRAWDAVLRASGWVTAGDPLSVPLSYYAEYGHKPDLNQPGLRYLATSLPQSDPYYRAIHGSATPGQSVDLVFRWAERPEVSRSLEDFDAVPGPSTVVAWRQKSTVSPNAVESAAFTRYQYVAIATINVVYYDSAVPARTPVTYSGHENCRTGSDTCD